MIAVSCNAGSWGDAGPVPGLPRLGDPGAVPPRCHPDVARSAAEGSPRRVQGWSGEWLVPRGSLLLAPLAVGMTGGTPDAQPLECNIGGPMSRTCTDRLVSSLLGTEEGEIVCPRRLRLGIDFGTSDPLQTMYALLEQRALTTPEQLRALYDVPPPMLCAPNPHGYALKVDESDPADVLREALLLGLCTSVCFDPARPVIWTRTSLTRKLELFETAGFYA